MASGESREVNEMSATNWAVCPNCLRRHAEKLARKKTELLPAYGVLPLEEFDVLRAEVQEMERAHDQWGRDRDHLTLREDYNRVGVDEGGDFSILYVASCQACPFDYRYEFTERALTDQLIEKYRRTETD